MDFRNFWYVVAESNELKPAAALARRVLDERLVAFRDEHGHPVVLQDRCLHRAAPLSFGRVRRGRLQCAYHGWTYDGEGRVVAVPSLSPCQGRVAHSVVKRYAVREVDAYVYVRLTEAGANGFEPFRIPYLDAPDWRHLRLQNRFHNTVTNCVENFVDIPHTAYVHQGVFRSRTNGKLTASVRRANGSVQVSYGNERRNLGTFSWLLNPAGRPVVHTDSFHMPNVTCVEYAIGPRRQFVITSQSVPVSEEETLVYTDLAYNYGMWNWIAGPVVRRQACKVIDQDIAILDAQMEVIRRYGARFSNTPADVIHVYIESIRHEIERGRDPRLLPEQSRDIEFGV